MVLRFGFISLRGTSEVALSRKALEDGRVNLRTLREPQGEAVAFLPDGRLILSSESGLTSRPSIVLLTCELG